MGALGARELAGERPFYSLERHSRACSTYLVRLAAKAAPLHVNFIVGSPDFELRSPPRTADPGKKGPAALERYRSLLPPLAAS